MQRARAGAMEGGRSEDGLRHGLPSSPAHTDALHAARGPQRHLQRHQLRARHPARPPATTAAAASSRAPAPTPSTTTAAPARAPTPTTGAAPAPARAGAGARRATGQRASAEARQEEEAAAPRPVRPRPTTTTTAAAATRRTSSAAAAAAAAASGAGAGSPAGSSPRHGDDGCGPAGVLAVHAVAAAEVGGDAAAARVLLRGVPVQLPDAGAGGHLQHRHRRQPPHHHLQRGEPQRVRHRLSALSGGPNVVLAYLAPAVPPPPLSDASNALVVARDGEESGSLLDVRFW